MKAGLLLGLSSLCWAGIPLDSQPMPRIEVARYMGRWYEIARYPKWFERGCHAVTADYTLQADGTVAVLNSCRKGSVDGPLKTAKARAWSVEPGNSRFKVRFFWPFNGDYWIIHVDPKYQWAVVGHPKRKSLWILSRAPTLTKDEEADILKKITELGYDVARLERGGQKAL
jgi:apolipoprotein D and lipocalin family protein